ncbi:VWA domain-containing protein [Gordonia sp. N1V]|uniref:VWA domain-containing protein n=1 Tax=Gordonia sp. N1V TaxID=3034163 RepID=UPI0023E168FD|nr:VWA domain-containing protein [Gordonia sp. N1V]MDF3285519.1 VWA domain-containing protein [Gordonia sp. N1V]
MPTLPWHRPPESFLDSEQLRLCRAWQTDGGFGLLLVGDAGRREAVMAFLRPDSAMTITAAMTDADVTADETATGSPMLSVLDRAATPAGVIIPAADLIDPAVAALLDCDRILASAPDVESVPPVLLSRVPVVVGLGVTPTTRSRRLPAQGGVSRLDWAVRTLAANEIDDHRLDIGTVRCLDAVSAAGGSPSTVLARNIIEPRLGPLVEAATLVPSAADPTQVDAPAAGDAVEELDADEAEVARLVDLDAASASMPEWASVSVARRYLRQRRPGRQGAMGRTRRGRIRRVVEYDAALGLDIHSTLTAAGRRGRLDREALRSSIHVRRGGRLTIVIVDRSDSMSGVRGRVAAGRAIGAIEQSIANRSKVAVIVARGATAQLVVEPTRDLRDAYEVIAALPSGGGTPLASAFLLAVGVIDDEPESAARVLVVSDGGSNVRLEEEVADRAESAVAQAENALGLLVARCEQVVVVPTANPGVQIRPDDLEWLRRAGAVVRPG